MGVSFKVAKVGTRFRPKVSEVEEKDEIFESNRQEGDEDQREVVKNNSSSEGDTVGVRDHSSVHSNSLSGSYLSPQDLEVSFTLNVFPNGYSVEKPSEILRDVPKVLLPYDRASKILFSAIEYGLLPGDILDDIPCKFVDGALCCEVRDYRKCVPKLCGTVCSLEKPPIVNKVHLQMCMENVVKDISSISDDSWTYNDLLEVESRILKSLKPQLCLDPTPLLDRLCGPPVSKKLNLGIFEKREERKQSNKSAANLVSNGMSNGTNVSSNEVLENSHYNPYRAMRDGGLQCAQQDSSMVFQSKQQTTNAHESCGQELPLTSQSKSVTTPSNFTSVPKSVQQDTSMGFPNKQQNTIMQESFGHELPLTSQRKYQPEVNNSESVPTAVTTPSNFTSIAESAQQDTSMGFLSKQQNTIANVSFGHELPLKSRSKYQAEVNRSKSLANPMTSSSNFTSIPEHDTNFHAGVTHYAVSFLGKRDRVDSQSTPCAIAKRPRQKQLDSVQVQTLHGQMDSVVGPSVQHESTALQQQQQEANKISAKFGGKKHSHMFVNHTPEAIVKDIPRLQARNPSNMGQAGVYNVQQVVENGNVQNAELGNISEFNQVMDIGREQLGPLQLKVQRCTPHSRAHIPSLTQRGQIVKKDLRGEDSTKKRRTAQIPRLSSPASSCSQPPSFSKDAADKSASLNNSHNSREKQASVPGKRKNNSRLKNACAVGSSARANNGNASCNASSPRAGTPSSLLAKTECCPVFERFQKIKTVTERYRLNFKKRNFDFLFESKPLFGANQLLEFHLSNSDNTEDVNDPDSDEIFMARLLLWRSLKISITRLMKYLRKRRVYQGNGFPIVVHESQRLIMSENPEDGVVDVYVFYGAEEATDPPTLSKYYVQHLPNTHSADLYAAQFTSLLRSEGYDLISKQLQPVSFHTIGARCIQQPPDTENCSVESGGPEPLSPTPTSSQSSTMLSNMSRNISVQNPHHIPSNNILAELLPGNVEPALQFSTDYLPKHVQVDRSVNIMSLTEQHNFHIQTPSLVNGNRSPLGYNGILTGSQMVNNPVMRLLQQQHQQQHSVMQKTMVGGLGMEVGMTNQGLMQSGGGPVTRNLTGVGVRRNVIGMGYATSPSMGGYIPGLNNGIQNNDFSTDSNFNNLNQHLLAAGLRSTNCRGKGKLTELPIPGNLFEGTMGNNLLHGGSLPSHEFMRSRLSQLQSPSTSRMGLPNISMTTSYMNNQQQTPQKPSFLQLQPSPNLQQEELDRMQRSFSPLQPQLDFCIPQELSSHPTNVSLERIRHQARMKSQHIYEETLMKLQQQSNSRIMMMNPMSPQLSSQTYGSVSSIPDSPMENDSVISTVSWRT